LEYTSDILRQIRTTGELPSQIIIDEVYTKLVTLIEPKKSKTEKKMRSTKGVHEKNGKRWKKRYLYGRYQELYKKNPGLLAKHIREGIDWIEDPGDKLNPTEIQTFYTALWGDSPAIAIPFDQNEHNITESPTEEFYCAITQKEIKARLSKMKNGCAPGPDGMEKKHITQQDAREALRLLFNLLLITQKQPSSWKHNKTILIPKLGKDPNKIENLRPLTISPILCRMYWGIVDQRIRANTTLSLPGKKVLCLNQDVLITYTH
jgi:hypothetical protein